MVAIKMKTTQSLIQTITLVILTEKAENPIKE